MFICLASRFIFKTWLDWNSKVDKKHKFVNKNSDFGSKIECRFNTKLSCIKGQILIRSPAEWKTVQTRASTESGVNSSMSRKRCKVERSARMVHSPEKGTISGEHIFLYTLSWYAPRTRCAYEYSFTIEIYFHTDILYTYCSMSMYEWKMKKFLLYAHYRIRRDIFFPYNFQKKCLFRKRLLFKKYFLR